MPTDVLTTNHPVLKCAGSVLPPAIHTKLLGLEVESTYNRPDVCLVTFDIDANSEIHPALELGKPFEIAFKGDTTAAAKIFEGEITALEFDSMEDRSVFIVQAEDKFHRLFRGDHSRTFLKSTVSDAVTKIVQAAGLSAEVTATGSTLPFQMQQNVSDGDWLIERAGELGYHVRYAAGKVLFGKVGAGGDSGVTLELNQHLMGFNCRATATTFVKEATVRSWDVVQKKKIEVKAAQFNGRKDAKVAPAFDQPTVLLSRSDLGSPDEATKSAQAALDRANEHNLQAEGRCYGDAKLMVDKTVAIKGVNNRFDGKYRISHLRHRFSHDQGFTTEFSCRGASDQTLAGLVSESAAAANHTTFGPDRSVFEGATVGIVTDNDDPDGLGRVKVKLPALADDLTTDWLRIAFPGGGGKDHHGWYLLPEVDDEVLVIFEQGDVRRGYVLGGLHNGKDKPFYNNDKVLNNGKVNQHAFRCNSGAHLLFDENSSEEVIEIKNKDGKFFFKYSSKEGVTLENKSTGDKFAINNKGDLTIVSESGDISLEAKAGAIKLKAMKDVTIDATGKVGIKATQDASMEGMNAKISGQVGAEVKGGATAKLEASGQTTVKGAMVMIN